MKTAKSMILGCSAALLGLTAAAQTPGDLLKVSQYNYSFGTARSAALGGAFTSLGADLASMNINPAGLGMYRSSDVGITPSVTWSDMQSQYMGRKSDYSKSKFALGNVGAAFNLYQGSRALTSFTLGVGYNKMADFNTTSLAAGRNGKSSINDIFAENLAGVNKEDLKWTANDPYTPFRKFGINRWGGILAYQTGILDPVGDNHYTVANNLAENAGINPSLRNITEGSIGEYDISGGFNFQNIVYAGFTVGIQDIFYHNQNNYYETYPDNPLPLNGMNYIRSLKMDGTGVNFKFGLVIRPTDNFRIGVAIHTPTFISVNEEYVEYMSADYKASGPGNMIDSPYSLNEYNIKTPTRFLAGLSYTLPGIGLITADYERVWYNGMQLRNMNGGDWSFEEGLREEIKGLYKPANNFRVGIEATPLKNFYLRAGYAYYDNNLRISDAIFDNQANVNSYENYSGGLGYRFQNMYVDLAYTYTSYKYAPYDIFYFEDKSATPPYVIESGTVNTKQNRNTIAMTIGVKF